MPLQNATQLKYRASIEKRVNDQPPDSNLRVSTDGPISGSVALSSCMAWIRREGQLLHVEERYYNPDALGMDDLYVLECLRLVGTAEAIAIAPDALSQSKLKEGI